MSFENCQQNLTLIDGFSIMERILMRIALYGCIIIAAYSISSVNIYWGIAYMAYVVIGVILLTSYLFCCHCPYPYEYSSCLFFPAWMFRMFIKYQKQPLTKFKKITTFTVFAGFLVIPVYWLIKDLYLFVIFGVLALAIVIRVRGYICKHCRFFSCPSNLVDKRLAKSLG